MLILSGACGPVFPFPLLEEERCLNASLESACSMQMDETLSDISDDVKNFAVIYLVDVSEVPDFVSVRSDGLAGPMPES